MPEGDIKFELNQESKDIFLRDAIRRFPETKDMTYNEVLDYVFQKNYERIRDKHSNELVDILGRVTKIKFKF